MSRRSSGSGAATTVWRAWTDAFRFLSLIFSLSRLHGENVTARTAARTHYAQSHGPPRHRRIIMSSRSGSSLGGGGGGLSAGHHKLAEKLSLINDRGVGMLTRIYNIKKVTTPPSGERLAPTVNTYCRWSGQRTFVAFARLSWTIVKTTEYETNTFHSRTRIIVKFSYESIYFMAYFLSKALGNKIFFKHLSARFWIFSVSAVINWFQNWKINCVLEFL